MARKASEKLGRLVQVQRRIEQAAEADLAETNRERDRVLGSIEETVGAMGSLHSTHLDFSRIYARRIAALTTREHRLHGLAGVQERRLSGERAKAERLEEGLRSAEDAEARAAEDEQLYDLLDQIGAARLAQASRKLRDP